MRKATAQCVFCTAMLEHLPSSRPMSMPTGSFCTMRVSPDSRTEFWGRLLTSSFRLRYIPYLRTLRTDTHISRVTK
jgi:hypothetical protein